MQIGVYIWIVGKGLVDPLTSPVQCPYRTRTAKAQFMCYGQYSWYVHFPAYGVTAHYGRKVVLPIQWSSAGEWRELLAGSKTLHRILFTNDVISLLQRPALAEETRNPLLLSITLNK